MTSASQGSPLDQAPSFKTALVGFFTSTFVMIGAMVMLASVGA